tara:strand:+ start:122 stop:2188 length:2067 start_codon:yes stop_codon:yes gene_type:complete
MAKPFAAWEDPEDWAESVSAVGEGWKSYQTENYDNTKTHKAWDFYNTPGGFFAPQGWKKPGSYGLSKGQQMAIKSWEGQAKDYWGEAKNPELVKANAQSIAPVTDADGIPIGMNTTKPWTKSMVGLGTGKPNFAWTPFEQSVDFAQWHEGFWNPNYAWTGEEYNYHNPYGKAATSFISEYTDDERERGDLQVASDQLHFVENDLGYSISDEGVVNPFQWDEWSGSEWGDRFSGGTPGLYTAEVLGSLFDTDTWRGLTIEQKSALQNTWANVKGFQDVTDFKDEYLPYESSSWEAMLSQEQRENWGLDIARTYDDEYWKADDFGLLQDESETFNLFRDLNIGAVDWDYYNQDADLIAAAKRLDPTFSETVGFTSVEQIRKAQLNEKQFQPEPVAAEPEPVDVGVPADLADEFTITEDNPYIGVDDSVTGKPEDAPTLDDYEEQQEAPEQLIKDIVTEANQPEDPTDPESVAEAVADQEDAEAVIVGGTELGDQPKADEVYGDEIDQVEDLVTGVQGEPDYEAIEAGLDFGWEDVKSWAEDAGYNIDNLVDSDWVQQQIDAIPDTDTSDFLTADNVNEHITPLDTSQFATTTQLEDAVTTFGDWDSTLQTWNAGNEVIANMMKQAGEQAASDAERNRVIASYGSQGRPINKIVKGVRTINELNNPLTVGDWGGPKQSFNRKGMRISNLNL